MIPSFNNMPMPPMFNPSLNPVYNQNANLAPALYVGDLDESVTEDALYSHFSKFGPIFFIKLARHPLTKTSKGFAYVNFFNPRDADKAKSLSQYEKLGNKPIRVMFRTNNIRDLNEGNIFVKNLDPKVTVKELHNLFSEVGNVLSAKISTDATGQSLGYGYVQFEKTEDAEVALEKLNGTKLKDNEISLSKFSSLGEKLIGTKKNLYVKNLPNLTPDTLENKLKTLFGEFGEIESILVKKADHEDKYYAFICFKDSEQAQKALDHFNNGSHDPFGTGLPLYVSWHQKRNERSLEFKKKYSDVTHQTNLYLRNLKPEVTEERLMELFNEYGEINSVKVKEWTSPAGSKSKFGFIDFKTEAGSSNALATAKNNRDICKLFIGQEPYIGFYYTREQRAKYFVQKSMLNPFANPLFASSLPYIPAFPPMLGGGNGTRPANTGFGVNNFMPSYGGNRGYNNQNNQGGYNYYKYGKNGRYNQYQQQNRNNYVNKQWQGQKQNYYNQNRNDNNKYQNNNQQQTGQQQPEVKQQNNDMNKKINFGAEMTTYEKIKANLREFLGLSQEEQRNILGNLLYPIIYQKESENASKITGMLVDLNVLEVNDVLEFFEDPVKLEERIAEAKEIIAENDANQQ